jgi:2'-5' RNA ligase
MALAVVNYPTLSEKDFRWIQSVREKYDKLFFNVVAPHFTLVFPTENISFELLFTHIQKVAERFEPFEFTIRCATVGDPDFMEHAHLFLIPDEGFSKMVKLHDAFYRGPLEPELRLDLPFVPHIGIASLPKPEACKKLADELNAQNFEIRGKVEMLDIIRYDGITTETIRQIGLITN